MRAPAALTVLALLSPTTARAETCAPRVELSGDPDAVARVSTELASLGVAVGAGSSRCPAVMAQVELDREGGIAVAVHAAADRRRGEGRVVSDATVAAAWIDSWLRDELEVATWAGPVLPLAATPAVRLPATATTATTIRAAPAAVERAPTSLLDRYAFSVAFEHSWTDDATSWNGLDVAACARRGSICLGGRVRAAFQPTLDLATTAAERSEIVALATASIPMTLGQVSLAPELGIGIGRLRTRRVETCPLPMPSPGTPSNCDPMDPTCMMQPPQPCIDASGEISDNVYIGDEFDHATYAPRVAIGVRLAFPIVRHLWLDAAASLALSPLGSQLGPTVMNPSGDGLGMPAEPTRGYLLGIGLRVGTP